MPRLNSEEINKLLSRNGIVHIATVNDDGSPFVVPLGYVYHDQQILLTARERVGWLTNIRRDPRVCLSIDSSRYPLSKITIRGEALIVHEPGEDDLWRDLRVPLPMSGHTGPIAVSADGTEEWTYDEAYRQMTYDEPRALVSVSLGDSEITSWRLPLEGEPASQAWASRYYSIEPRHFVVSQIGRSMYEVRVVTSPDPDSTE
jgi:hypothetical protein